MIDLSHWPIVVITITGWIAALIGLYQAGLLIFVLWLWKRIRKVEGV